MSDTKPTIADYLAPILNEKAVARLRGIAESMIAMGEGRERIDGRALNMLLDIHERNRAAYKTMEPTHDL